jgi:hypothetical protein
MLIRGQSRKTTRPRLAWDLWRESISKKKTGYEETKQRNYMLKGKVMRGKYKRQKKNIAQK